MAAEILKSIMEQLQSIDVDRLKYILRDNLTGKFYLDNFQFTDFEAKVCMYKKHFPRGVL